MWEKVGATQAYGVNQGLRNYMVHVFKYMAGALGLTGIVAFLTASLVSSSPAIAYMLFGSPLKFLVMFAPLGIVLFLSFKLHSMEVRTAQTLFWSYALLMGVSLSAIFLMYTSASVARAFLVASITFTSMAMYGYTTKKDLTALGSLCIMAVIGLIIASIVNIFLKSGPFDFILSAFTVLIFIGLTAYDAQKMKSLYYAYESGMIDEKSARKFAIIGALSLYIDFINIFISLLRMFGERRD
jgi:FtsH-binding integral membrane protein